VPPEDLIDAIRVVAAGDALLAPSVTRRLPDGIAGLVPPAEATTPPGLDQLTDRELEVLASWPKACPMPRSPPSCT
jgi:DNA-binding NarL/FixJ family response regulator